jgi:hypothetical protein
MEAHKIIFLTEYSNRMSQNPDMLNATNPAVWNATVLTMRTAAFFRYVKSAFPGEWQNLVSQVREKSPQPAVRTPTVLYKAPNSIIEQAIKTDIPAIPDQTENILVYPNPVKDLLHIDHLSRNSVVSVISPEGKVIIQETATGEQHRINLKGQKPGIYLLRIDDRGNGTFTKSIMKSY